MKYQIAALVGLVSAEFNVYDDMNYCDYSMPLVNNDSVSFAECASYCKALDSQHDTVGGMCCDFEGFSDGRTNCALYDSNS